MPTYQNGSTDYVILDGQRINPGETYTTNSFLENLPTGVTQTSSSPYDNPVLLDQTVTSDATITVPAGTKDVLLVLYADTGDWTVKFNSASASPVLTLLEGMSDTKKFWNRRLNAIYVSGTGQLQVRMEKA